jgi:hypothetical protein
LTAEAVVPGMPFILITEFDTDHIGYKPDNGGSFLDRQFTRKVKVLLWILSAFIRKYIRFFRV